MPVKIAVFFDGYLPFHEMKEGNLLLGLRESGADVSLVTTSKPELDDYDSPVPMTTASPRELTTSDFWRGLDAEVVLAYTFLNWHFTPTIRAIKAGGKALVIRADSDGRIGRPMLSRRLYVDPPWTAEGLRNRARRAAWKLSARRMAELRLQHLALADAIFIESPGALSNVACFLAYWRHTHLLNRIRFIPMTISDDSVHMALPKKTAQVAAVGRWSDWRQKNTSCAVEVLVKFLQAKPDFQAVLIGPGEELLQKKLRALPGGCPSSLVVAGSLPQTEVADHLAASQILFMPSNWEGFPLAAGEAVCLGCSITGSPIESLQLLSQGGRWGTLSPDFSEEGLLGALVVEANRWESGRYMAEDIASFWRPRINRRAVGTQLLEMAGVALESLHTGT